MAIVIAASDIATPSSETVKTFSFAVPAGNDRVLFVATPHGAFIPDGDLVSVTFNGDPLTEIWGLAASFFGSSGWYMVAPDVGTFNIVATASNNIDDFGLIAVALTGVHQSAPIGTPNEASGSGGSDPTVAIAAAVDDLVFATLSTGFQDIVAGAGVTDVEIEEAHDGVFSYAVGQAAGATSVTMAWNGTTAGLAGDAWVIGGVAFKPAPAGDAVGAASGSAAVTGISEVNAVGTSAGVAAVSGVGNGIASARADASGIAVVTGIGLDASDGIGASASVATVAAVGTIANGGIGASAGAAGAQAVGNMLISAVMAANGIAVVSGVSPAADGIGESEGSGQAFAVGLAVGGGNWIPDDNVTSTWTPEASI